MNPIERLKDLCERIEAAQARQKGDAWVEYENIYGANATSYAKHRAEILNSKHDIERNPAFRV